MRRLELIFSGLAATGLLMRLLHLDGGRLFLTLGLLALAFLYLFLGFAILLGMGFGGIFRRASYRDVSVGRVIGGIGAGWALSTLAIGVLFQLQHYAGAQGLLLGGLALGGIVLVVSLIRYRRTRTGFSQRLLVRVGMATILGLCLSLSA